VVFRISKIGLPEGVGLTHDPAMFHRFIVPVLVCLMLGCGKSSTSKKSDNPSVHPQILNLGNGAEPEGLDPHVVTGVPEHNVLVALIEGLVGEDPKDLHPVPGVAERWENSEDGLVWTFHLRSNARWSTGDTVTAQDFVLSYKRMLSPKLASQYAYMLHVVKNAKEFNAGKIKDFSRVGFEAVDEHTLKITLAGPTPYFLSLLNHYSWFPVHIPTVKKYGPVDSPNNPWTRPGNFVGNGPFVLDKWEVNDVIVVKKSPTYWDKAKVSLKEINFKPISSAEVEERAFRSGQIHVSNTIPLNKIDVYRKKNPQDLRLDPYLGVYFYRLNVTEPPLDNKKVRQALALAIDRESLVRNVLRGADKPTTFFTPPDTGGYTYNGGPKISFDPDRASRLLAEAGYPQGKGFPKLKLLYNTSEAHQRIAEAIQQMWQNNLKVQIELTNEEWKVYLNTQQKMEYQVSRAGWIGDYNDPNTFLDMWLTGGGNNYTGFTNEKFDQLIASASQESDSQKRFSLFGKAEEILLDEMPIIPIYHYTSKYLASPKVKGWHPTILNHHPYKHVSIKPGD